MLELNKIKIDGNTQSRVALSETVVDEYTQAMLDGVEFPPVVVFYDGSNYWLADGFHRYFAARKAGKTTILESINKGTINDAKLYSSGANSNHGLMRTNADKRNAVKMTAELCPDWSDRQIAKHCGVSVSLVGAVRRPEVAQKQNENRAVSEAKRYEECSRTTPPENNTEISKLPKEEQIAAIDKPLPKKQEEPAPEYFEADDDELQKQLADLEIFYKICDEDDKVKVLVDENKQLKAENKTLRLRINGLMAEKEEAVKLVKSKQRQIDRLEKERANV